MPTVSETLKAKGSDVVTISPDATVLDAARLMNDHRIGALVVLDKSVVVGMFTERDVMTRVVAAQLDPKTTKVGRVMSTPVISCTGQTTLDELRAVMRAKRVRHIPVVDHNRLAGIISIGDLNTAEARVLSETIMYMEQYMYGG